VTDGDIIPDEPSGLAAIAEVYCKALETSDLERRLQALEKEKSLEKLQKSQVKSNIFSTFIAAFWGYLKRKNYRGMNTTNEEKLFSYLRRACRTIFHSLNT
jgi:hypothetical protein